MLFVDGKLAEYNKTAPRPDFTYIDYGLSIVKREIIESCPANRGVRPRDRLSRALARKDACTATRSSSRFYEIGSPGGLREADEFFEWER